jgi:hypothetical protein
MERKTLDDYHLQIRSGLKFGFDFAANLDAKIGVLRKHVKECNNKQKVDGSQPNEIEISS